MPLYHLPPAPPPPGRHLPSGPFPTLAPPDPDFDADTAPAPLERDIAWARHTPIVPLLHDWLWWREPVTQALGAATWRHFAMHLMQHASSRDLRAIGFVPGTREGDRPRRWTAWPHWPTGGVLLADAPGRLHRAVVWWENADAGLAAAPSAPATAAYDPFGGFDDAAPLGVPGLSYGAALWLDGRLLPFPQELTYGGSLPGAGEWIDGRYFVLDVDGPPEHPDYGAVQAEGHGGVLSLLVVDARHRTCHLLNPRAHEPWVRPAVSVQPDGRWRIDADRRQDRATAAASRVMTPAELPPAAIPTEIPDEEAEPRSLAPAWRFVVDAWNHDSERYVALLGEENYELALSSFRDAALGGRF